MTQTSGSTNSYDESQQRLDEFETRYGLTNIDALKYDVELDIGNINIKGLSTEECYDKAMQFLSYSFNLQRLSNVLSSQVKWYNETINYTIRNAIANQSGYSYEERRNKAIAMDNSASKLNNKKIQVELKLSRISFLNNKLEKMADLLIESSRYKRKNNYE